jgi:hypothetical protein
MTNHVDQAAEHGRTYWNGDRRSGVHRFHSANQTVRGINCDRSHTVFSEVLLYFAHESFLRTGFWRRTLDRERVENGWDMAIGEFHVNDGTNNLDDATLIHAMIRVNDLSK